MNILSVSRGSVVSDVIGNVSSSIIKVDGFQETYTFVTGFSLHKEDKHSIIQCFNEKNFVYAFGHNPEASSCVVEFTAFMNAGCEEFKDSGVISNASEFYNYARISKRENVPVKVSLGVGCIINGFLKSVDIVSANTELNTISVRLTFIVPSAN